MGEFFLGGWEYKQMATINLKQLPVEKNVQKEEKRQSIQVLRSKLHLQQTSLNEEKQVSGKKKVNVSSASICSGL